MKRLKSESCQSKNKKTIHMLKKIIYILSFVLVSTGFYSCSTDFDVVGEYQETTVVYGLLDQSESLHFIKVNKSFLGAGDAYNYAMIRDSSEYENVDGKVEEWNNGVKVREWILRDTLMTDRGDGVFFGPEYIAYYFVEPNLNPSSDYKLVLDINEGQKEVSASTKLIGTINFHMQTTNANVISFHNGTSYSDFPVKFYNSTNGKRFDVTLRLNWLEVTATDTTARYLDWYIGSDEVVDTYLNSPGAIVMEESANGVGFFQFVANRVEPNPNLTKRIFKGVNVIVSAASQDLYTYMIVNSPSSGLVQERPQFTNVTNGIGIFSAKYNCYLARKPLNKNSLEFLCNGPVTGHLGFCSDTVIYSAESFYCQ